MRIRLKPLADQSILITGASSGIGRVTAKAAAAAGARVTLVARSEAALASAVTEIEAAGGRAAYAVADVADRAALDAAARIAVERFGGIDSWVNNAGGAMYAKLVDTPADEHERMLRTNYLGVVNGCLVAVEHLKRGGGALVTVGSIASDLPSPVLGAYAATKHAAKAYVEALRMELAADDIPISVTLVKPSGIDTPITQHAANHSGVPAMIPPPVYDPQLVADAILNVCAHRRRSITVGGMGRVQVLLGTHFPWLLDRLSGLAVAKITDPAHKQADQGDLFTSTNRGDERSGKQPGRTVSLYTGAQLHPVAAGLIGAAAAGAVMLALRAYRRP